MQVPASPAESFQFHKEINEIIKTLSFGTDTRDAQREGSSRRKMMIRAKVSESVGVPPTSQTEEVPGRK